MNPGGMPTHQVRVGRFRAALLSWLGVPITLKDGAFWREYYGNLYAGQNVTVDSLLQLSTGWSCVRLISETIATLPLKIYERLDNGGKREAPEHRLYELLHDQPNADMTAVQYWEAFIAGMLLRGAGYGEKQFIGNRMVSLDFLLPQLTERRVDRDGRVRWFYHESGEREIQAENLMHVPGFSLDGKTGLSPMSYARRVVGGAMAAESASETVFGKGLRAAGFLKMPGFFKTTEQRTTLRDNLKKFTSGGEEEGSIFVLEGGADFTQLSMNPEDAQMLQTRAFGVEEICRWFRVPPWMVGHTEKSTSWGCLPGDSLVFTEAGPKAIEAVKIGEKVWSLEESRGMVLAEVTNWRMTGVRSVLTIETRGRTLRATDNHQVPVRRYRGYKHGRKKGECGFENVWIRADEIEVGDFLMIPHGLPAGSAETSPDGRRLTIGAMELCGLYSGDGSVDGNRVEIAHEESPDHMEHYCECVRVEFGVEPYVDDARKTRTRFSSKEAIALLHDFGGTALTKRVPGWVFGLKPALQLAFIRGYLDSDGTVTASGQVSFASASKILLEDVRHLCIGLGIPVGIVAVGAPAGEMEIRGRSYQRESKYVLNLASLAYNSRIGSNSEHKRARFNDVPTSRSLRYDDDWTGKASATAVSPMQGWEYRDLRLHRVTRIGVGHVQMPVYDITVTGTASFVADGILVHNTGIEQQMIAFAAFTLRPWLWRIEQAIRRSLLTPVERRRYFAAFSLEGLLQADSAARAAFYSIMTQNGIYTRDECRRRENLPVMGGNAEVLTVQSNLMPIDRLGMQPAAPTPPAEDPLIAALRSFTPQ